MKIRSILIPFYFLCVLSINLFVNASGQETDIDVLKKDAHTELIRFIKSLKNVDPKFVAVRELGSQLESVIKDDSIDIKKITINNDVYWKAFLTMAIADPLVYLSHSCLHIKEGELSRAKFLLHFAAMLDIFNSYSSIINDWLGRIHTIEKQSNKQIELGIKKHDIENFDEALSYYKEALKIYPNNPWAYYEIGFTNATRYTLLDVTSLDTLLKSIEVSAPYYKKVRDLDPLYSLAYQGDDSTYAIKLPILIAEIIPAYEKILLGEDFKSNLKVMAHGFEKIGLFDYALYTYWIYIHVSQGFNKENAEFIKRNLTVLGHKEFGKEAYEQMMMIEKAMKE